MDKQEFRAVISFLSHYRRILIVAWLKNALTFGLLRRYKAWKLKRNIKTKYAGHVECDSIGAVLTASNGAKCVVTNINGNTVNIDWSNSNYDPDFTLDTLPERALFDEPSSDVIPCCIAKEYGNFDNGVWIDKENNQ